MDTERGWEMTKILNPIDVIIGEACDGHAELVEVSLEEIGVANRTYRGRNGKETLALIRRACGGGRGETNVAPLVILDCDLPHADGVDVLRALKSDPRHSWIPVIMMTASYDHRQAEQCRNLGCDAYVAKWTAFLGLPSFVRRVRSLASRASRIASRRRSAIRNHLGCTGTLEQCYMPNARRNDRRGQELGGKEVRDDPSAP